MHIQQLDLTKIGDLIEKSISMKNEIIALRQKLHQANEQVDSLTAELNANAKEHETRVNSLLTEQQNALQTLQDSLVKTHKQQLGEAAKILLESQETHNKIEQQLRTELTTIKQTNQFILNRVRGAVNES